MWLLLETRSTSGECLRTLVSIAQEERMDEDRVKLVHAAIMAMVTSPEFVDALVKKVLAVAPAQPSDNRPSVPNDGLCQACGAPVDESGVYPGSAHVG